MVHILYAAEGIMDDASPEPIPASDKDFKALLEYLGSGRGPAFISPQRFAQLLHMDIQTLANSMLLPVNTLLHAPESAHLQVRLRDALRVIQAGLAVSGSVEPTLRWFKESPLQPFGQKTAQRLCAEGRSEDLLRYLQSMEAGFAG
ncbi:hypothetical protein [Herbaspirillum seropedicae]|uniref:hypothetical protein n=1 Tax=Herbaspirillum seropedicae TaxID=964 RepID=UPI000847EBA7|nr:hypothetical protein [Herbaspirillum seropedicae]